MFACAFAEKIVMMQALRERLARLSDRAGRDVLETRASFRRRFVTLSFPPVSMTCC
jgi:hypothetical protein